MKSKVQKRREACERIKAAIHRQERAIVDAALQIQRPVGKDELRWYGSVDAVRRSRAELHASFVKNLQRMKAEVAHLESL